MQLGIALGVAATRFGRDKVTIVASPGIADLGAWLEQLLAESTGKQGRGLIPLADEPPTTPEHYGSDRLFAYLELEGHADPSQQKAIDALSRAGHPVARISVKDVWHVGQEFFRWEIATAVAGAIIGIDPFNQPDVEASKEKTRALTDDYERSQNLPAEEPVFRENGLALYADPRNAAELGRHKTLSGYLKSHIGRVHDGDYVALLAYIQRDEAHTQFLTAMRTQIRDQTHAATCLGFGPRFLHSTGQTYKGGPNSGVFLQITCDDPADLGVPGHAYSFGVVKAAQASGDLEVLGGPRVATTPASGANHMQIGVIGLGRMGGNISSRLMKAGHRCVVFDVNPKPREALAKEGATAVGSMAEAVKALTEKPRVVWVMLPAGRITEETIESLAGLLEPGDVIVDGGNTFYKDDIRRAKKLAEKGIGYIDCGTSGGVWGMERGYCMMIGGSKEAVDHLDPIFAALAPGLGDAPRTPGREKGDSRPERGYIHAGPCGAGHFVKMVHNGIEYGLMQAYAEGFDILRKKASPDLPEDERFVLNMPDIAEVWRRGSVISSWLLDLGAAALAQDPQLTDFSGFVQDSGEGRWTVEAAIEEAVPADVLTAALYARFRSRLEHTFGEKLLSAMRFGFGGHIEGSEPIDPEAEPTGSQGHPASAIAAEQQHGRRPF